MLGNTMQLVAMQIMVAIDYILTQTNALLYEKGFANLINCK